MKKSFLVGNFLPAYSSVYRYRNTGNLQSESSFRSEELESKFIERADRYRRKNRSYNRGIHIGLILSLLLVTGFFNAPFRNGAPAEIAFAEQELVQVEEILQTRQDVLPPPPPRPPVPVEVPDEAILDDDDLQLDATLDISEELLVTAPPPPPVQTVSDEPEIFVAVQDMPELIGGLAKLTSDLEYPDLARKAGLEGMVVVEIVVDSEGLPRDPVVVKSVADVLDKAAVEAVMKQRFKPGMQRNRPVSVRMALPVKFQLR